VPTTPSQRKCAVGVDHENREKNDFYPTPPHATEALLRVEKFDGAIWEPACGDGAISKVLEAAGYQVISTDLVDRSYGETRRDFLMEYRPAAPNIVTNPPFKLSLEFVRKALELTSGKVAILARLAFLEGAERRDLYDNSPIARVWVFSQRVKMFRGGWDTGQGSGMICFRMVRVGARLQRQANFRMDLTSISNPHPSKAFLARRAAKGEAGSQREASSAVRM